MGMASVQWDVCEILIRLQLSLANLILACGVKSEICIWCYKQSRFERRCDLHIAVNIDIMTINIMLMNKLTLSRSSVSKGVLSDRINTCKEGRRPPLEVEPKKKERYMSLISQLGQQKVDLLQELGRQLTPPGPSAGPEWIRIELYQYFWLVD